MKSRKNLGVAMGSQGDSMGETAGPAGWLIGFRFFYSHARAGGGQIFIWGRFFLIRGPFVYVFLIKICIKTFKKYGKPYS